MLFKPLATPLATPPTGDAIPWRRHFAWRRHLVTQTTAKLGIARGSNNIKHIIFIVIDHYYSPKSNLDQIGHFLACLRK